MMNWNIAALVGMLIFLFSACVQPTYKRTVSFTVDAKGLEDLESMSIRGAMEPLSWKENFELQDADGDSLYIGKVTFDTPYDFVEVKFVKNGDIFELENKPNRKIYFEGKAEITYHAVFDGINEK